MAKWKRQVTTFVGKVSPEDLEEKFQKGLASVTELPDEENISAALNNKGD